MPRKPWVGGNWKCNLNPAGVDVLVKALNEADYPDESKVDIVVAPSHIWLTTVASTLKPRFVVSAQDSYSEKNGAYTGAHSCEMLLGAGIKTTILGHSERRKYFHESNEEVGTKVGTAQKCGMMVIACLGEKQEERESGQTNDVIVAQLEAIAKNVVDWNRIVIAYEPVWAIGTGKTATPEIAQEAHAILRGWLVQHVGKEIGESVRIVYGGSVNGRNAEALSKMPDIDGFLVGGASLKPEFLTICSDLAKVKQFQ